MSDKSAKIQLTVKQSMKQSINDIAKVMNVRPSDVTRMAIAYGLYTLGQNNVLSTSKACKGLEGGSNG